MLEIILPIKFSSNFIACSQLLIPLTAILTNLCSNSIWVHRTVFSHVEKQPISYFSFLFSVLFSTFQCFSVLLSTSQSFSVLFSSIFCTFQCLSVLISVSQKRISNANYKFPFGPSRFLSIQPLDRPQYVLEYGPSRNVYFLPPSLFPAPVFLSIDRRLDNIFLCI